MYRPLTSGSRRSARRGALLIAVLGLLTLFAIFALFFVFYADAEATGARIAREKEDVTDSGPPNDYAIQAFNFTMRSVLFDELDVPTAQVPFPLLNPLRGHSLARTMYGWNGTVGASASNPFSGHGTFHDGATPYALAGMTGASADSAQWINFSSPMYIAPANYFRDPEWTGNRIYSPSASPAVNQLVNQPGTIVGYPQAFIPKNAPYTYPDLKDLILAALSPATGEVMVKSLHRDWLFNGTNPNQQMRLAPWDPNQDPMFNPTTTTFTGLNIDWVTPEGRTRVLRPRPIDQMVIGDYAGLPYPIAPNMGNYSQAQKLSLFGIINNLIRTGQIIAYPSINADGSFTGDVQNLQGTVGQQRNDSILIDIGLPPRQWNGRWIKPLASLLVSDLDGLLNLNAHGNMRASPIPTMAPMNAAVSPGVHGSYAGYGPHEVNLGAVLGNAEAVNLVMKRYGVTAWQPSTYYFTGQIVANYGNFYVCVNPPPVPAGPPPGWQSAPPSPGPTAGPTGSYPSPATFSDGAVQWSDVSINLARNGASTWNYSGTRTPAYAAINFDAGGNNPSITLPAFPSSAFQTNPTFSSTGSQDFFDDGIFDLGTNSYNKYFNNPLLFNTKNWASTPIGTPGMRTFPHSDTKRLTLRYAADRDWYLQTDVSRTNAAPASLIGSTLAGPGYRLDGAHARRGLTGTLSSMLDLPGLVGNFNTSVVGLPMLTAAQVQGGQLHPTSMAFTGSAAGGTGADFVGPTDLRNPAAGGPGNPGLGPIDLNRPLTDYRSDLNTPLGQQSTTSATDTTNSANYLQAWADRHNLARDILGRLIVATGANATVFTQTTTVMMVTYQPGDILINATQGSPDFNAIRYLAQLAANMVDMIDSDDISTGFVWNPLAGGTPPNTIVQVDATSLQTLIGLPSTEVVYGVEKPRLVINEAYGEITNNPAEGLPANGPAVQNAAVRFYVELKNPTSAPYVAGTGPLGNGGVTLYNGTYSPYVLQVSVVDNNVSNALTDPTNSTGTIPPVANRNFTFDFSTAAMAQRTVSPVNNSYAPVNGTPGFALAGASAFTNAHMSGGTPVEFNPDTTGLPYSQMIQGNALGAGGATTRMEYDYNAKPAESDLESTTTMQPLRRHVVLLRRLANPYQTGPTASNPYITVDVMDYVPAYDAVVRGGGAGNMNDRNPKGTAGVTNAGFESITSRYSVGKVQPYAGLAAQGNPVANDLTEIGTFPTSMIIRQDPNPAKTTEPQHTFYRMNGRNAAAPMATTYTTTPAPTLTVGGVTDTIMAPFDWFVHYDRAIVNPLELLSLQATKPHEVTQYFLRRSPTGTLSYSVGLAPWLGYNTTTNQPGFDTTTGRTNNGLYRALDSLRVKSWVYGNAVGGKVHGKININTIQDARILSALLDVGAGNVFNNTDVGLAWGGQAAMGMTPAIPGFITNAPGSPVVGSRTVNSVNRTQADGTTQWTVPMPGPTYDDVPNPSGLTLDRPFRTLGAPEYAPDPNGMAPTVLLARNGSGIQDTMLRVNAIAGSSTFGAPLLNVSSQTHAYAQAEMARKMFNNATTTSNAFAITVTIVFHEVRLNGVNPMFLNEGAGNRYLIGKEAYKDVPGDLRQQFYAIVDRSNLGLQLPGMAGAGTLQPQPFSAALDQPVVIGNTAPSTPPMGFINPPTGSYNLYLTNSVVAPLTGNNPYTIPSLPFTATVYADGKPVVIGTNSIILLGVGTNQEPTPFIVNYVNQDGSLNVGDLNPMNLRPVPVKPHAAGELVSNSIPGNPGPQPLFDYRNAFYSSVVPYAKRVK